MPNNNRNKPRKPYPDGWKGLSDEEIRDYARAGEAILREKGRVSPNSLASFAIVTKWRDEQGSRPAKPAEIDFAKPSKEDDEDDQR